MRFDRRGRRSRNCSIIRVCQRPCMSQRSSRPADAASGSAARCPSSCLAVGGRSILERSVAALSDASRDRRGRRRAAGGASGRSAPVSSGSSRSRFIVAGGARRQDSVMNAFQATSDRTDVIVVHDAARPFARADLISRTIAAAAESGAALAALPARDTVKRGAHPADGRIRELLVAETLPRESIFLAQTPQAFRRDVLRDALALGDHRRRDRRGGAGRARRACRCRLVARRGDEHQDHDPGGSQIAEAIAQGRQAGSARAGRASVTTCIASSTVGRSFSAA